MPSNYVALAAALWIALTALLTGGALLRITGGRWFSPALRLLVAVGVGLGAIGYLVLALGLLGVLSPLSLILLLGGLDVLGLTVAWRLLPELGRFIARLGRASDGLRPDTPDRIESETIEFHRRVRAAYLGAAERDPSRFVVIDAGLDPKRITERVTSRVDELLRERGR